MKIQGSVVFERSLVCTDLELLDCREDCGYILVQKVFLVFCFFLRVFNVQI